MALLLSPGSRGAHLTWTPLPGQRARGFDLNSILAAAEQNMQDDPAGSLSPAQTVLKDGIFMRKQLFRRRLKAHTQKKKK